MIFCLADKNDVLEIAKIHKTEIKKGFLSSFKLVFLKNFYLAIIESNVSFCVVAKDRDRVVGFVAGVIDINAFYFYFIKNYFLQSVYILFPKIFSFSFSKKVFETLLYPIKEKKLPSAELLTMAVASQFQGQGIAGKMFLEFTLEMKRRGMSNFKVLVGEELTLAIRFYEKNGFTFLKNTTVHKGKLSRIYTYKTKS